VADDIRTLSARLAQDPHSLAFLELGELLRRKGQLDAAHRVALAGLGRHPHNANAHDLYARILTDKRDYERAFDEWDMALRIAPKHLGALKGLAFLYFKVGDIAQAEAHLAAAQRAVPDDPGIAQALAMVRGAGGPGLVAAPAAQAARDAAPATSAPPATAAPETPTPAADAADQGLEEASVFTALDGGQAGLLLVSEDGLVVGGGLRNPAGRDVGEVLAAYLAGVSQEATRTAKRLALGEWTGLSVEGRAAHVHVCRPRGDALLAIMRDRAMPLGRLAVIAQRAAHAARRWLERQA
jgi:predicted regulator of Ras-like GTPase activity (Roadblock/LC7/MglB family)/Tfp pilus assembly protein PilF